MRDGTIARNYAEALLALAQRHDAVESYGEGLATVARALDENPRFRTLLETPRIDASEKKDVVLRVFGGRLPPLLINFLRVTIDKRRQRLLGTMAREYRDLVDQHQGRAHVEVTVARPLDDATVDTLGRRISGILGVEAIPHVKVSPAILGGVVLRTGDTIYDGSLRRRLESMRRQLLAAGSAASIPVGGGAAAPTSTPD